MLSRKIIAHNISNLTDARYFAAWAVEFMSFNVNPNEENYLNDFEQAAIIDWVEGPIFLAYLGEKHDQININEIIANPSFQGVILHDVDYAQYLSKHFDHVFCLIQDNSKNYDFTPIVDSIGSSTTISFLNINNIDIQELNSAPTNYGFLVQGGKEEKIGLKSFDELDQLYDLLIDEI